MISLNWLPGTAFSFILIFARVGTILMLIPALGETTIPARMRLTFALGLTLVMLPLVSSTLPVLPQSLVGLVVPLGHEIIIGLIIGKMYERTRSLVPGILLHMFYNTSVVALTMHLPADETTPSVFDLPAIAWLLALASGGAGAFMLYKLLAATPPTRANTARLADD